MIMGKRASKKPMTFDAWKVAVNEVAKEELPGLGDVFAEDDPYDLEASAAEEFGNGTEPGDFFEQSFEEDLARRDGDDAELAEANQREVECEEEA
jgi:hypothetical protein